MYRWTDHTAEVELQIEAASVAAVFEEALSALAELLEREPEPGGGAPLSREVTLRAPDRETLLVEWLNEVVFLAETEGLVPERAEGLRLEPGRLVATIRGRGGEPSPLVKAVTYHRLGIWQESDSDTWRARVIFDV